MYHLVEVTMTFSMSSLQVHYCDNLVPGEKSLGTRLTAVKDPNDLPKELRELSSVQLKIRNLLDVDLKEHY